MEFETLNFKDMNKLDKQFEEMMKGVRIDSPSSDFTLRVMSRVQAEAAVMKHSILEDYQPVISKRTWIILIVAFVLLIIYILLTGKETNASPDSGFWSMLSGSLNEVSTGKVSSFWQKGMGLFTTIPPIAYLILTASLALWTLDSFLTRFMHHSSHIHVS